MANRNGVHVLLKFDKEDGELLNIDKDLKKIIGKVTALSAIVAKTTSYTDKYIASQRVLNQTFGETTKTLNEYINNLARMTGISTTDISQKTALFGQMAMSLGMSSENASEFSMYLDDLSTKLAMLYNIDFRSSAKALLDAVKGESSTLTTLTGIVIKTQSLQNTLNELGLDVEVKSLNGANKALLEYITVAKMTNQTNKELGVVVNDVAWQKQILSNQVKELATAIGNLLYPVLRSVLPILNAILMVITDIINFISSLIGKTKESKNVVQSFGSGLSGLGDNAKKTGSELNKSLRGFDKLNAIMTPKTTSSDLTAQAGISAKLLESMRKTNEEMLNISNRAREIADNILTWLGFSKDVDEKWKFSKITLGSIITLLVGGGGLLFALKKIFDIVKKFLGLKTTGLGDLIKGIFGLGGSKDAPKELSLTLPTWKTLGKGLAELAVVVSSVLAFIEVLGIIYSNDKVSEFATTGIKKLVEVFKGLGEIILQLGAISIIVAGLGIANFGIVLQGVLGLATIIAGIELLLLALGKLSQYQWFNNLNEAGATKLILLGKTIGEFGGAIVEGAISMASQALPIVGKSLADFMENANPFFEGISNIPENMGEGVKQISLAILALSGASLIEGITRIQTLGTGGLKSFGKTLKEFAPNFVEFANIISGIENIEVAQASAEVAKSIAEFANRIPPSGGQIEYFAGKKDLQAFGKMLPEFGTNLKQFSINVSGLKKDVVEHAISTADVIVEFAKRIPPSGGLKAWVSGDSSIKTFSDMLPDFGTNLRKYSENVAGLKKDVVDNSISIANVLVEFANTLPKMGGIKSWWEGKDTLTKFGSELYGFGNYLSLYASKVENINIDKISRITNELKNISDVFNSVKDNGVVSTMGSFGDSLKSLSSTLSNVFSTTQASNIGTQFGKSIANSISKAIKNSTFPSITLKGSSSEVLSTFKMSAKAEGGFVDSGEIFIARENGLTEMIGKIGNRTAVANNDQIVEAISTGVARANAMSKNNTVVKIVAEGDSNGLLDFITFKQKERDRQYGF